MQELIEKSLERLRAFEPLEGYYLAFSGGKDSIVIYALAKMAGVKFDAHYNITTVDPPELVHFIKNKYPEVERIIPRLSMWQLMLEQKSPPTRLMRYCCTELKEHGGTGRFVITGVRWAESVRRKLKRKMIETWPAQKKQIINPIIDWSDEQVWRFIKDNNIEYCCLYDQGFDRLGCILCPMSGAKGAKRDIERWPKFAEAYKRIFAKIIEIRKAQGMKCSSDWETAEKMFAWWITRRKKEDKNQCYLSFE